MASSRIRSVTSFMTAFSLAAALVIGVFSQSHAAIDEAAQTAVADPCPGHMTAPVEAVSETNCLTLCDAADMDLLIGVLSDRSNTPELDAVVFVYQSPPPPLVSKQFDVQLPRVRGPPGADLYLLTQRLRL